MYWNATGAAIMLQQLWSFVIILELVTGDEYACRDNAQYSQRTGAYQYVK